MDTVDADGAEEGSSSGEPTADAGDDGGEMSEPTPQSAALRRQQRYVGIGGAVLAGVALATVAFQQFTDSPVLVALAGLAGAAVVLWLARKSIFPGKSTVG